MQVLVIDDDHSIRTMLELVLGLEGFEVAFASEGAEGVEEARRLLPDIVILDIMMPAMDGLQVAELLAADERTAEIPVIFCSAMAESEELWKGWQGGRSSHLAKPFDNVELVEEVLRMTRPATV